MSYNFPRYSVCVTSTNIKKVLKEAQNIAIDNGFLWDSSYNSSAVVLKDVAEVNVRESSGLFRTGSAPTDVQNKLRDVGANSKKYGYVLVPFKLKKNKEEWIHPIVKAKSPREAEKLVGETYRVSTPSKKVSVGMTHASIVGPKPTLVPVDSTPLWYIQHRSDIISEGFPTKAKALSWLKANIWNNKTHQFNPFMDANDRFGGKYTLVKSSNSFTFEVPELKEYEVRAQLWSTLYETRKQIDGYCVAVYVYTR
jgi:hypothetical protein